LLYAARTEAKDFIYKIQIPTLYTVFPEDPFTGTAEFHRAAFDKMGPNGEFCVVQPPAGGNMESVILSAVEPQVEFLRRVVGP
jgi:hypothetical protein